MHVSIENLEGLERRMTVEVPVETVSVAVDKKLKDLTKTARIDGFRPGKIPLRVIQQKFGSAVREEVIGTVIQSSYWEAIGQENLRPAGMPNIENIHSAEQEAVSYTAVFEVYPEIKELHFESIEVEKLQAEVSTADIDAMVEQLRKQRKTWVKVERAAIQGDQVTVDFEGRVNGDTFPGGSGDNTVIEIGAGQMLPEFEAGLEGISIDEEKIIDITFPENYQTTGLRGKTAQFTLKATAISAPELPELDVEFIKALGVEGGDLEQFRLNLKSSMEKELAQRIQQHTKNTVLEALLAANTVIAPSAVVAEELRAQKMQALQRMGQDAETADMTKLPDEMFLEGAKKRVQTGLLLGELIRREKIELDKNRVEARLNEIAASYQEDSSQVREFYQQNQEARKTLENGILEEQVVEYLLNKAKISEKQCSFEQVMRNNL